MYMGLSISALTIGVINYNFYLSVATPVGPGLSVTPIANIPLIYNYNGTPGDYYVEATVDNINYPITKGDIIIITFLRNNGWDIVTNPIRVLLNGGISVL
jgi:hypothetical protein